MCGSGWRGVVTVCGMCTCVRDGRGIFHSGDQSKKFDHLNRAGKKFDPPLNRRVMYIDNQRYWGSIVMITCLYRPV